VSKYKKVMFLKLVRALATLNIVWKFKK